jgi:hypothetical protein
LPHRTACHIPNGNSVVRVADIEVEGLSAPDFVQLFAVD